MEAQRSWLPELIYADGKFQSARPLTCDDRGFIPSVSDKAGTPTHLRNCAVLPGLINAHSHAFQRVIRGRTEYRTTENKDSFWTWREMMYSAAERLSPEDVYDASRMAFLEMALSGITSVGEFHYLHHAPGGQSYEDPNLLAKEVVRAAQDVGLRMALLRVAYARSGFETEPNPKQQRFIDGDPEIYLKHVDRLIADLNSPANAWVGLAPHSVRAVPLDYLRTIITFANTRNLPIHMHVAEQPAEISACIAEYGRSPVALLATEGLLNEHFTAVHAIHVSPKAVAMMAQARALVCACPTTERNLGDGVVPVDLYFKHNVRIALGTDSHVQIDLLEDARELEYNLRLQKMERAVLSPEHSDSRSALAARLFECATSRGAESIGSPGGNLNEGSAADFFTVDLDDPSIAGATKDDLLSSVVFSLSRAAVKDVFVGGQQIVSDGRHAQQEEIVSKFKKLQKKLWG
ncbi:MAG TPA: formimidoylglutamate deiminase [Pyrinomonadaceae bacterium]|nr:formimidoylglutamate deiminase [Pyrinomonadaceae bacterium]